MYGVIALFIVSLFSNAKRSFNDTAANLFLLIAFINVYFHPKTIKFFPIIFLGFILYRLVSTCTDVKNLRSFFKVIAVVSLLNTAFAIFQFFGIHFIYQDKGEIIGLMSYKTQFGIYQALALPICFYLNPWLVIIPAIGLLLSNSGTALIAGVIGMIYLLWKNGFRIYSSYIWVMIITSSAIFLYKHFHQLTIRFPAWIYAIKNSLSNIVVGNGVGTFKYVIERPKMYPLEYPDPYSIYLEVFYSFGILGIVAFLFFIKDKFSGIEKNSIVTALSSSCLVLAVVGFGYSFMDYPRLAGTAIILFGLLTAVKGEKFLCS